MKKSALAEQYFSEGCNCCQAVLLAFAHETGLDRDVLARLSSSFGAGMGGLGEVCGAVTGMLMVLGADGGYGYPADSNAKAPHAAYVREAADTFKEQFGSYLCRELKFGERDRAYCTELVRFAAALCEQLLETKKIKNENS
ncbi:MAG: C_GCAxxG_C_C family protein [Clostridia bacterium]|nr:C_GCAxxG_C_C family protein [Clostridia bacterium]